MFGSSLRIAEIAGIRIGVHYTWFVILALLLLSLTTLFRGMYPDWSQTTVFAAATVAALLFFVSIVLHELGHSLVAIARGIPVHSITLFIFGGVAQSEEDADTAATEFWVAIAGPLVSFALAATFYVASLVLSDLSQVAATAAEWLATINLVVGIFNLVPGFPLDGGRVFRALVWGATGDAVKGMRWAVRGGRTVAMTLMLLGVWTFLSTGLLINGLWLVAIGWFLMSAAEASGTQFVLKRVLEGVPVRQVMRRDVPRVPGQINLEQWVDEYVFPTGQRAYLVMEGPDVIGLLTLSDARKVARADWALTPVWDVMTPLKDLRVVTAETGAIEALQIMEQASLNQVPVVRDNVIEGWVDREKLLRMLQLHLETGR